jgi:hypothetical protein
MDKKGANWYAVVSKKKYSLFDAAVKRCVASEEDQAAVMQGFKEVFEYDPEFKQYTPELGKRQNERLRQLATQHGFTSVNAFLIARRQGKLRKAT